MMKISVIIPVYNVENYLEKCINSIINQTYKDLEIILVDDGSTDSSGKICDDYSKKDDRIIVIHKNNNGVSSARNDGLRKATGDYISFIDPDDYIEKDLYTYAISMFKNNKIDVFTFGVRNIDEVNKDILDSTPNFDEKIVNNEMFLKLLLEGKETPSSIWNKIFKAKLVKNIFFDENMKISEDLKWLIDVYIANKNQKTYMTSNIFYNWIKRKNSAIQGKRFNNDMENSLNYCFELEKIIQNNYPNLYDIAKRKTLISLTKCYERCDNVKKRKELKKMLYEYEKEMISNKNISLLYKLKYELRKHSKPIYDFFRNIKNKNYNNKRNTLDSMKLYCFILVVIGHVCRCFTSTSVFGNIASNFIFEKLTSIIYAFQMPCWMIISGAVFYSGFIEEKYNDKFKFILNKSKRLLIPYMFFGLVFVAPTVYLLNLTDLSFFKYILFNILLPNDCKHLWYLIVLFMCFTTTLFTSKLIRKKSNFLLLFSFIISMLSVYCPEFLQIKMFTYYQLYFYLGIFISMYYENIARIIQKKPVVLLLILFLVLMTKVIIPNIIITNIFYGIIGSFIILVLANFIIDNRIISFSNKYSFGIYLIHPMIIYIIFYLFYNVLPICFNVYLCFLVILALTIFISIALSYLFKKCILRVFIGEKIK